jgi:hypothetical protein
MKCWAFGGRGHARGRPWYSVPAWTFHGQIFALSLGGAGDRLANDALAGMQGLELPRGPLSAS